MRIVYLLVHCLFVLDLYFSPDVPLTNVAAQNLHLSAPGQGGDMLPAGYSLLLAVASLAVQVS